MATVGGRSFRGHAVLNLDDKGRLAIPARQREVLARFESPRVVITAHPHRCLVIYPEEGFAELEEKLRRMPASRRETSNLQRLIIGHASEADPDSQGRVPLTAGQRSYARLDKRVVLVGVGNRMEVWDEAAWEAETGEAEGVNLEALAADPTTADFSF